MAPRADNDNLHVAHVAELPNASQCGISGPRAGVVYTGSADGPVLSWSPSDGKASICVERPRDKPASAVCLVNGTDLWVGGVAGDLTAYTVRGADGKPKKAVAKVKGFVAHAKGVNCVKQIVGKINTFVVTGGADKHVRVWTVDGKPHAASAHHGGAVTALVVFKEKNNQPAAVWSGGADGKVYAWKDEKGDSAIDGKSGKLLTGPGKGGVTAMCVNPDDTETWVGYEDGRIRVFARDTGAVKNDNSMHSKAVTCLVPMGDHVWSASLDHLVVAWDARTKSTVFILPDQGGSVRDMCRVGWSMWVMNDKCINIWAAASNERELRGRVKAINEELDGEKNAREAEAKRAADEKERLETQLAEAREQAKKDREDAKKELENTRAKANFQLATAKATAKRVKEGLENELKELGDSKEKALADAKQAAESEEARLKEQAEREKSLADEYAQGIKDRAAADIKQLQDQLEEERRARSGLEAAGADSDAATKMLAQERDDLRKDLADVRKKLNEEEERAALLAKQKDELALAKEASEAELRADAEEAARKAADAIAALERRAGNAEARGDELQTNLDQSQADKADLEKRLAAEKDEHAAARDAAAAAAAAAAAEKASLENSLSDAEAAKNAADEAAEAARLAAEEADARAAQSSTDAADAAARADAADADSEAARAEAAAAEAARLAALKAMEDALSEAEKARLKAEAEELARKEAEARRRAEEDATQKMLDEKQRELNELKRQNENAHHDAGREIERHLREIEHLKRQLEEAEARAKLGMNNPAPPNEIFELQRRIMNIEAERQLEQIEKEKARQLREAAESRRMECEAKLRQAEVELARSRTAIERLGSLEADVNRLVAEKAEQKRRYDAELRAATSEADRRGNKLEAELRFVQNLLERKRDKKRAHKRRGEELARRLEEAVAISKSISADATVEMHKAKALATVEANAEIAKRATQYEANAATAAAAAENAAQLSEMLERKRAKKRAYKLAATEAKEELIKLREQFTRASLDRDRTQKALKISATNAESAEKAYTQRTTELEDALKQAMRDYKNQSAEIKNLKAAKLNADRGYEHVRVENEGLAHALTTAEDAARYYEKTAADSAVEASREKVRAEGEIARREYLQRYAAAEQDSRQMKRSFDQRRQEARGGGFGGGGGVVPDDDSPLIENDENSENPGAGRRDGSKEISVRGMDPASDPSYVRPAGMSSEHVEHRRRYERRIKENRYGDFDVIPQWQER